jgi:6-phosphogluconolactonase
VSAEVLVASDAAEQAALGAELVARAIDEAVRARGVARVALSGGETPVELHRRLARLALPWGRIRWYWVDERAVAPDAPRSNYGAAARDLRLAETTPPGNVHRMEADAPDLHAAALRYRAALRAEFGVASAVAFDVLTLGVGDDGHTASMFPGLGLANISDHLVVAVPAQPERGLEARLTLTTPVIREARFALAVVRGAGKRGPVERARSPGPLDELPARVVETIRGRAIWLLDAAAAGRGGISGP